MNYLGTGHKFTLNSENMVSFDTLKREYMDQRTNNDFNNSFKVHLNFLVSVKGYQMYSASYNFNDNFSNLDTDDKIQNTIKGFVQGYDDGLNRYVFAVFIFSYDDNHKIVLNSLWLTIRPIDKLINSYDYDGFNWTKINKVDDYLDSFKMLKNDNTIGYSLLH